MTATQLQTSELEFKPQALWAHSSRFFPQLYTSQHLICELKIQDFHGGDPIRP